MNVNIKNLNLSVIMPAITKSGQPVCNDRVSSEKDKGVAARVEELLREQLLELGEDPASLAPHLIMQNMQCEVYPDESMVYIWKDIPILRVAPERTDTGVMWRMFTRDEGEPLQ